MYVDAQTLFSDAQAITAAAASTNLIDLGAANVNLGTGRDVYLVAVVDVAFTDSGSDSTLTVALEMDTAAAFSSATTAQTIGTFGALSAIGARLIAKLQPEAITERFIRLQYTPNNGNLTTGSLTAFLTEDIQAFTAFPDGFTIS